MPSEVRKPDAVIPAKAGIHSVTTHRRIQRNAVIPAKAAMA